jgi:hypothetical protein
MSAHVRLLKVWSEALKSLLGIFKEQSPSRALKGKTVLKTRFLKGS